MKPLRNRFVSTTFVVVTAVLPASRAAAQFELELPEPADLMEIYEGSDTSVKDLDLVNLLCSRDQVESCEDLGGIIEVAGGFGCLSTGKVAKLGLSGNTRKLSKLAAKGKLGFVDAKGTPQIVPAEAKPEEILARAQQSDLVLIPAAQKDQKKWFKRFGQDEIDPPGWGCNCTCNVYEMIDAHVTNARRGDVALTPTTDGRGEDIVRTIMEALGQNHRHALMFIDDGQHLRHTTALNSFDADDLETNTLLKPEVLENATPGMLTDTITSALASGRLGYSGLLLTHSPTTDVIFRPFFEDAAAHAEAAEGYYKINDYTNLDGMDLAYASPGSTAWEDSPLRGTHCSGFMHWAFEEAGLTISEHYYSRNLRKDIAKLLHRMIRDDISSGLGFWQSIGASILGVRKKIANQVVNCFADLGCDNNDNDWKRQIGASYNVAPDNLLPEDFTLRGSGCAPWEAQPACAGDTIDNAANGAPITPFTWVEPLNLVGSSWQHTVLEDW